MKILIITFGSHGDVLPYVALGAGLKATGHEVTICTSCTFEALITEHGLGYGFMTDELLKLIETDAGRKAIEEAIGLFGIIKTMIRLMKATKPLSRKMLHDSWAAAQSADPDILIYHPKAIGGIHIAEKLGIPAILTALQPMIVPTAEFPTFAMPRLKIGGWYNRLTYKLMALGFRTYTDIIHDFRKDILKLGPFPKGYGVGRTATGQPVPILHAFSRHVVPRPNDWPAYARITGYWFMDSSTGNGQPPADLKAFLDNGDPPVYAGFGSMAGRDPERLTETIIDALQQSGSRGIIASGWGGLSAVDLPDSIMAVPSAPHDWLFPRTAAVIHHGGAGTTAAGLRAGRPTIICPFFGDQPFWGNRVNELGVGPTPIPQKKLTVSALVNAIRQAKSGPMQEKAEQLGEKIREEHGIQQAIGMIEQIAKNATPSGT